MKQKATAVSIAAPEEYIAALRVLARRRSKQEQRKVRVADLTKAACDSLYPEIPQIMEEIASFFAVDNPVCD